MDLILENTKWNVVRNDLKLDRELEKNMLDEEFQEWQDALLEYFKEEKEMIEVLVELIDAVVDFQFVKVGSNAKGYFSTEDDNRFEYITNITLRILVQELGIGSQDVANILEQSYNYVVQANNNKPIKKTSGKVEKGSDWRDPKELMFDLLEVYYERK